MQKIAVFGGTFNPIHNGHIHLAKQFAQRIGAQKVLLIPTYQPPHKRAPDLAPGQDRLEMCRLACEESNFEVSDMELRRGGSSYTADTLRELKKTNPDSELYLITGEDMFLTLKHWYEAQTIFRLAVLCAAPRSSDGLQPLLDYAKILEKEGARTFIRDIEYLPISSTMVRNAVRDGQNIADLVPPKVADYIAENKLYLEQKNE
ncbi:nicotinate (nicotinamide) nucleotide adenylyltransferase [Caproiciproducens faecalis]|uniref:Probable nicotinate-nucleotide adenylyltransferase n=1 Tax=Caproiciproducens faecalis TaxID=2820301 RepID=A0ABS7DQK4_9FIRM|nr:nicotinate (nicotinamide) nucleotide adenylyltransferase [Caproiciproducens faecalis]MBW7573577.1 nicotinate (nicotinamide) nucleotide adenylyltransferase [Caproiciproducens faecalis]